MKNSHAAVPSSPPASRRWRLDPRVVAHLRAPAGPLAHLLAGALAPASRSVNPRDKHPNAFAATKWADTEWADTCSDWLAD